MAVNNNAINAQDLMENESVSWLAFIQCFYTYQWMEKLISTATGMCGHGLINSIVKIFIWLTLHFLVWVPVCLFYRPACFFIASWIRLLTGVGGKSGLPLNIFFVSVYTAALILIWIPFLIPAFLGPVTGEGILGFFNVI